MLFIGSLEIKVEDLGRRVIVGGAALIVLTITTVHYWVGYWFDRKRKGNGPR